MTREESYKETKVCRCICCGKDVVVTKFASAAKVMCDECKANGATPNPEFVATAAKSKRSESRSVYGGDTKVCKCIKWGKDVVVGDRTIDVHIRKLRQKIGGEHIVTVKGVGYKFE